MIKLPRHAISSFLCHSHSSNFTKNNAKIAFTFPTCHFKNTYSKPLLQHRHIETENKKFSFLSDKTHHSFKFQTGFLSAVCLGILGFALVNSSSQKEDEKKEEEDKGCPDFIGNVFAHDCSIVNRHAKLEADLVEMLKKNDLDSVKQFMEGQINSYNETRHWGDFLRDSSANTIIESSLEKIFFQVDEEIIEYLAECFLRSEEAVLTNMNMLHFLARNGYFFNRFENLVTRRIGQNPQLLTQRMTLSKKDLQMSPADMAVRCSYDISCAKFFIVETFKRHGFSAKDKERLKLHANWVSQSGVGRTEAMGKKLMKYIDQMPVLANIV